MGGHSPPTIPLYFLFGWRLSVEMCLDQRRGSLPDKAEVAAGVPNGSNPSNPCFSLERQAREQENSSHRPDSGSTIATRRRPLLPSQYRAKTRLRATGLCIPIPRPDTPPGSKFRPGPAHPAVPPKDNWSFLAASETCRLAASLQGERHRWNDLLLSRLSD